MKKIKNIWVLAVVVVLLNGTKACDEYLDMTPDAVLTDKDIFKTYEGAQGFLDPSYLMIMDVLATETAGFPGYADDFISTGGRLPQAATGDYWAVIGPFNTWTIFYVNRNQYNRVKPGNSKGFWPDAWLGIRLANLMLEKIPLMVEATEEEKRLIEGQCYFFRAYQHWNLIKNWGGMPYVNKALSGNDDVNLPRLTYWETTEFIVADLDRAAALLPLDWDDTSLGIKNPGRNVGRITKGACLGLKAKALLWAGSPTMVNASTGGAYAFDPGYMRRAAEAAYEVIKLADAGVHALVPWEEYYQQFGRIDGFLPWSKETLVACVNDAKGYNFGTGGPGGPANVLSSADFNGVGMAFFSQKHGRNLSPGRFSGNSITYCVTQNMVDMFETASGLPIDDPASGYDPMDPWNNRDPRFRGGILVDQDEWTFRDPETYKLNMYIGGGDAGSEFASPYLTKKFWPKGANDYDNMGAQYRSINPNVRLAEIYLIYAEALNELEGPNARVAGASITAVEAVNMVRARAGMPNVHSKFTGNKDLFRERIRNERAVELFAEDGTRWYDLKRWHVAHLDEYKRVYTMKFDREHTYFDKVLFQEKVFEMKNYWMPIYRSQTQIYPEFYQNPGW